ncbi:MAG TPA: hypothetical protein VES38_06705 [Methylotenera sp.]|nr:hypothetical protein [Methylotenera sp.]
MAYETPVLTAKEMAVYVSDSPYKDYRQRCLELFKEIHGDEYAETVKQEVIKIFNQKIGGRK